MACKEGQFNVVELMVNEVQDFQYQFECSTCEWNDSFLYLYGYQILQSTSVEALSDFEGKDDIAGKGNKLSTRSNEDGIELG